MEEQIVFNPNPFCRKAYGYEKPKKPILNHWVIDEFGVGLFESGNRADRWIYFELNGQLYKATPEFLDDKEACKLAFNKPSDTDAL